MAGNHPAPAERDDTAASLLGPEPDTEESQRERLAAVMERRLDVPMAVLAVAWGVLVTYELVAPPEQLDEISLVGNIVWGIFVVEFVAKLVISGRPMRFLRRRWPSLIFLAVPLLRTVRIIGALRTIRVLPVARVVGSSYRTIGTARTLMGSRLWFLGAVTMAVVVAGGQLLFLLEAGGRGGGERLGQALWWSANLVVSGSYVFEPVTLPGRLVSLLLAGYAVVVFASLAATLGAFFVEQGMEKATAEEG